MTTKKEIVCFCQDITKKDILCSIDEGYDQIETLKRYTGVFMGPCQGKTCGKNVLKIFSEKCKKPLDEINIPTIRPPTTPIPLILLASNDRRDSNE